MTMKGSTTMTAIHPPKPNNRGGGLYQAFMISRPSPTVAFVTTNDADGDAKWQKICETKFYVRYEWYRVPCDDIDERMKVRV